MGLFNDTIREQTGFNARLVMLAKVYTAGEQKIITGVCAYAQKVANDGHYIERMQACCVKKCQEYEAQLEKLKITGNGNVYYVEELYTEKDAIASIVKQHIEILTHMIAGNFENQEDILKEHQKYVSFLQEFVKYRKYL